MHECAPIRVNELILSMTKNTPQKKTGKLTLTKLKIHLSPVVVSRARLTVATVKFRSNKEMQNLTQAATSKYKYVVVCTYFFKAKQ